MKQIAACLAFCFCLISPGPVVADTCHDDISALFDGGPLDQRVRPPHAHVNEVRAEDGALVRVFESRIETPLRTVAGVRGSGLYALVVDNRSWTGPTLDGPWSEAPNHLPGDRWALVERQHAQQRANLSEAVCPGMTELQGQSYLKVQFVTQTDPDPDMGGAWFGARNSVFIDPDTNRVMIWDMTDFRNSWSSGVSKETHRLTYSYDDTLRVTAPDGS